MFRNLGNSNNWLQIQLVGTVSQTSGTGAVVEIEVGGVSQRRVQDGGVHFRAQDMQRLHFGIGQASVIDQIDIRWPSGMLQNLQNVAANQILTVTEPSAPTDIDGDGVNDDIDNCLMDSNPLQIDADMDGYGNRCDADFNNDCATNSVDLGLFKAGFFGSDPLLDLDGDGMVNSVDLGIVKTLYFRAPGPSATTTICTP